MKKAVNGVRYDTEKSVPLGCFVIRDTTADRELDSVLYGTPRGKRFFLAGSGGRLTAFRGKEGLVVLSYDEALEIAYNSLSLDDEVLRFWFGSNHRYRMDSYGCV